MRIEIKPSRGERRKKRFNDQTFIKQREREKNSKKENEDWEIIRASNNDLRFVQSNKNIEIYSKLRQTSLSKEKKRGKRKEGKQKLSVLTLISWMSSVSSSRTILQRTIFDAFFVQNGQKGMIEQWKCWNEEIFEPKKDRNIIEKTFTKE